MVKDGLRMQHIILIKLESGPDIAYPPFGILYVAGALEKAGYKVTIFHEIGDKRNIQRLLEIIAQKDPLFIGFSTMTGPQLIPTIKASKLIKQKMPHLPIVWGGVHATISPEKCIEHCDIVCIGEGEGVIVELADSIENKKSIDKIKNLWIKKTDKNV